MPYINVETTEEELIAKRPKKHSFFAFIKTNTFKRGVWSIFRAVLLTGLAFVVLFPIISKFANALKPPQEMFDSTVVFIPKNPTFDNLKIVIEYMDYYKVLLSTVLNTFYMALLQTLVCTLVAYGFARFKFPGRGILFALVIVTVVIPPQALIFPIMVRFMYFGLDSLLWVSPESVNAGNNINLLQGPLPLVLMSISAVAFKNGLFIYMLRQYFKNIPKELEEAAFIDGAGYLRTFFRVMLPGALPLMMTVFLFSFVWMYNDDFYWRALNTQLRVMSTEVGIVAEQIIQAMTRAGGGNSQYTTIMEEVYKQSAVILHIIPLTILYIFTQRFFVQSIERSGLVG